MNSFSPKPQPPEPLWPHYPCENRRSLSVCSYCTSGKSQCSFFFGAKLQDLILAAAAGSSSVLIQAVSCFFFLRDADRIVIANKTSTTDTVVPVIDILHDFHVAHMLMSHAEHIAPVY